MICVLKNDFLCVPIIFLVDIDECSNNPCDTNAACKNNDGSYECTCNDGWTGDGDTCSGMFNPVHRE